MKETVMKFLRVSLVFVAVAMMTTFSAFAQNRTVTGKVYDDTGETLIGAGVLVEGTKTGTITDADGAFAIEVAPGQSLVVSYLGCLDKVVPVGSQKSIDVYLEPNTSKLDEVVVVGYATQKKINLTGSVSSVSARDIKDIPTSNTSLLLKGRLPGLVMTQNGAQAGTDNVDIKIRGIGTFGNNAPMVLIDGVEGSFGQIDEIPATEIESISVLKDAASAAIYGVRAANGVILITTKKGSASDGIKVNYQGSYTFQMPGILPNYIDGYNWALIKNERDIANEQQPTYDDAALSKILDGSDPDHYANTDWVRSVLRNAHMHQHHLSVSGGAKNTHYMVSVGFTDQQGIMKSSGVKRYSIHSNFDTRYKLFTFGANILGSYTDVLNPAGGSGAIMRNVNWRTHPTVPIKYSNGHYGYVDGSWNDNLAVANPVELISLGHRTDIRYRINTRVFAGIDIYDGLKFQTSFSYALQHRQLKEYTPKTPGCYNAAGELIRPEGKVNKQFDYYWTNPTWKNENLLTYNNTFGKHTVGVLLGHSVISSSHRETSASIEGFPTENIYELVGGTLNPAVWGQSEGYRLQSFFGRVNYSYDDRYLLEVNVRHDGSSRMPKANRYGTFPSVSGGWVFSNEKFLKGQSVLSLGKIRLSWGTLGNQEIGNYAYSPTLSAQGNYFFDKTADKETGMIQASIPNENIKWETTRTVNAAIDLGFFDNRLTTTFEWFDKKTYDILMQLSMPGIFLGNLNAPFQNVGAVRNRGWEWGINYSDAKGDWNWNIGFNVSHVKNTILHMGGLEQVINGNFINRVGCPIDAYFGYKAVGIYRTEEDLKRVNAEGLPIKQEGVAPQLGDIMYEDVNNDGNVNAEDRVIIGNPHPEFNYGLSLGFSWRDLDFSMFWQGVSGIYRYNWETTSDIRGNLTDRFLDRWSPANVDGTMPRIGNPINDRYSSFWLDKTDYFRLENLELGYTFRQMQLRKAGINSIRLYFSGSNLLTFTPLKNWDPEKYANDSQNNVHPNMTTFSLGVNIEFK